MPTHITTPEAFFGHQLGADRKIVRWDRIIEYLHQLARESDRLIVEELGKSCDGYPFLLVTISSPDNLANLPRLREISASLANPAGLDAADVEALVSEGKAVIVQTMSLHATEIGGTQMAPELAYDLLSRDDPETREILDNVVFLMVPCFNPDGQHMVTDWYNQTLGTEHEGGMMPWLYHKYCGHDNNRDAFALNLPESQYLAKLMFREWYPQAFQDHHHMGSYGARLYVAPYCDPIHPHGDPLIWREHSWYGAHMAYKLEEAGKSGILNAAQYAGWAHMGFHWLTIYHNIAGMLTESASARLATPLYIHPGQLEGPHGRTMPVYQAQTNFPNPWPGGWWRLRDIVEQQKISAWALLDIAARFKDTVLHNAYLKATRQTERGAAGSVRAFVIPSSQHDDLTVRKLVKILLDQGIEVQSAAGPVTIDGCAYPDGAYLVDLAQPKVGVIQTLLARTHFPDNYWTRKPDGSPMIYDTTSDTVAEYMGVEVIPTGALPDAAFAPVTAAPPAEGAYHDSSVGWFLDPRLNDSFLVVNRLLAAGARVCRVDEPVAVDDLVLPAGAFFVHAGGADATALQRLAADTGVDFVASAAQPAGNCREVKPLRIGMYRRYWSGNMDEGWTRLLLERFEFPFETLKDADILDPKLRERLDVIILPSDLKEGMVGPHHFKDSPRVKMMLRWIGDMPAEYRSGFGPEGVKAIGEFVRAGGRVIALDGASDLLIEACNLGVRNVVAGLDTKAYSTHGATLRVSVDSSHPTAYGMPECAFALNWDSPAFDIEERVHAYRYTRVIEYPERELLQSGWLIGEEKIAGKTAMLVAEVGQGQAVLIGFRPQFRCQTHGTFKLLFNSLI